MPQTPTNPSVVFDNGGVHLDSPARALDDVQSILDSDEYLAGDNGVDIVWKQSSLHKHFFEEVAELENIIGGEQRNAEYCNGENSFRLSPTDLQLCDPHCDFELFNSDAVVAKCNLDEKCSGKDLDETDWEMEIRSLADGCTEEANGLGLQSVNSIESQGEDNPQDRLLFTGQSQGQPLFGELTESSSCTSSQASVDSIEDEMRIAVKRQRNNEASKKFRQAKKSKRSALFEKERKLQIENQKLKLQLSQLQNEVTTLINQLPSNWIFQMIHL